ncbi:DUF1275 family protein [Rhizobium sp. Root1220]|uniref:YoaK family protein n=1 Tax=Rhizobium sp. Root1220 TaxID=1736432 RepID=UPI0006FAD9FC|nr:DUF1275 family protein [Rhizobium sp. Root1220]KQV82899.1 hypothetical protein ASC90_22715 [Rhizobium sp. Root1220]
MRRALPFALSLIAGYVDTSSFLALGGLFTAHITGNFVTLAAALALGTSGTTAKILALPVFCVTIFAMRYLGKLLALSDTLGMKVLLAFELLFLVAGCVAAISLAPFTDPDGFQLVLTGMLLVVALAIQNAAHRVHLASMPPTTVLTGTITQIMLDLADLVHGTSDDSGAVVRPRLARMATNVAVFAVGCGLAALLHALVGIWCFALPPLLALGSLYLALDTPTAQTASGIATGRE